MCCSIALFNRKSIGMALQIVNKLHESYVTMKRADIIKHSTPVMLSCSIWMSLHVVTHRKHQEPNVIVTPSCQLPSLLMHGLGEENEWESDDNDNVFDRGN